MKSSTVLNLTIMTGVAAAIMNITNEEPPQSYSSVADCIQHGKPEALCKATYEEAFAQHIKLGPAFDSNEECLAELDVNQCGSFERKERDGSIRQVIMPLMTGYLVGRNLRRDDEDALSASQGINNALGYPYGDGVYYHGNPLYRSRKDPEGYWNSSYIGSPSSNHRPNIGTGTVARRGFGGGRISGSS